MYEIWDLLLPTMGIGSEYRMSNLYCFEYSQFIESHVASASEKTVKRLGKDLII